MFSEKYRIHEIAKKIDRDKTTIIRWEKEGLIPRAKRDSRGWRYYSKKEIDKIIELVRKNDYFRQSERISQAEKRSKRISYATVVAVVILMLYGLLNLNGANIFAYNNQTTTMFTTVSPGLLDVISASSSNSFAGVTVSFNAQTSTCVDMGAFRIQDARGGTAGWTVNLAANDWKSGQDVMQLDYNGTGSDDDLGKMCLIVANGNIQSIAGQDTTNVNKGSLSCFGGGVSQITVYQAASNYGKGDYWITDFSLEQYIPTNPTSQSYTTTIVLTAA